MPQFIKIPGVRFNNPNLPVLSDLGEAIAALPGLAAWVNASDGNYYMDGAGNLALRDLSPAGADFVKPASNVREAVVVANQLNGYPVLRFSGASADRDGFVRSVEDTPTGASAELTYAAVVKISDVAGNRNIVGTSSTSQGGVVLYTVSGTGGARMGISGANASGGATGEWGILVGSLTAGRTVKLLDPVNLETINSATGDADTTEQSLYLGQTSSGSAFFVGDVAELIYTTSDLLSTANAIHLENLLSYFRAKFAI